MRFSASSISERTYTATLALNRHVEDSRLHVRTKRSEGLFGSEPPAIVRGNFRGIEPIVTCALEHDPYTRLHLLHVNDLAHVWGPLLGFDHEERELFLRASLLHDVGKLLIPDTILLKPAKLSQREYVMMQRHPEFGENILRGYADYEETAFVVGQHHEFFDGSGYPRGVRGEAIDPVARAVSIIDAFSAMTVDRPYHLGISEERALDELERCAGTQFDPDFVRSFIAMQRAQD